MDAVTRHTTPDYMVHHVYYPHLYSCDPSGRSWVCHVKSERGSHCLAYVFRLLRSYPLLGVTALAVSPNKKLIAVAERSVDRAVVTLYEAATLKRRRVLTCAELGSRYAIPSPTKVHDMRLFFYAGPFGSEGLLWSRQLYALASIATLALLAFAN
jgi:hypothetical protein